MSPDGTGEIVDEMAQSDPQIHPVHRSGKLGYASAHRAGMTYALERGAHIVVTMDADFSHDPDRIPHLIGALAEGADVAIGSRYCPGGRTENWPWKRRILSGISNRTQASATWGVESSSKVWSSCWLCIKFPSYWCVILPSVRRIGENLRYNNARKID